jgi:hypothetical protein
MTIDPEFNDFIRRWLKKAEEIEIVHLEDYFDKYFTLFVAYNRLYAMTTFILAEKKRVNISDKNAFPDSDAATDYVSQYVGARNLLKTIDENPKSQAALGTMIKLIEEEKFYIKLDMVTGARQPAKDKALLARLRSGNKNEKGTAVLEMLYAIRCNMFHGHKGFHEVQKDLLDPAISILERLIVVLREKIAEEG